MTRLPPWMPAYGLLLAVSAGTALLMAPILQMDGQGAELLLLAHQYILAPLLSLLLTAWAARRGVEPYAAFFPPFICLGLLPPVFGLRALPISVLLSCLLGILGANAGKELRRRRPPQ